MKKIMLGLFLTVVAAVGISATAPFPPWLELISGDFTISNDGVSSFTAGTITSADIAVDTIVAVDIAAGGVATSEILDATIVTGDIATGGVATGNILDATILTGDIATDTIVAGNIAAGGVATSEILDATILEADVSPITTEGLGLRRVAVVDFDCAVDTCTQGAKNLGVALPAKAIITRSFLRIETQFVDAGAGTVALHCEDANNILSAADITGFAVGSFNEGASTGSAATMVGSIAAACNITATVATADQSAGKLRLWVEYLVHP